MATVVITFFLLTLFCVCKMDADYKHSRRDRTLSQRETRWSMNSQRLEEIVAELMKPISDIRRSFDTDLGALLEEYLTEAGLHALEADEAEGGDAAQGSVVVPNFAELALLLQHSASLYGRKVDFLYQHVISVSESLYNSTQEVGDAATGSSGSGGEGPQTPASSKRRRRGSAGLLGGAFAEIEVPQCPNACREAGGARPPPTLPRMYMELEPRVLTAADAPLLDYAGEAIGLLTDYHVTWRLQEGLLVEELEGVDRRDGGAALRPLSLVELQRALEAAAPPLAPPLRASTPLPPLPEGAPPLSPPPASPSPEPVPPTPSSPVPEPLASVRRERKRKNELSVDDVLGGPIKILINNELRSSMSKPREFRLPSEWIAKVVGDRKNRILSLRKRLRDHEPRPPNSDFLGFDIATPVDIGGFWGWSESEVAPSVTGAGAGGREESDDDGFFEQSSLGESDGSRADESALALGQSQCSEWASWQAAVVRRAAEGEARGGVDVRKMGAAVMGACGALAPRPLPFAALVADHARDQLDVSRLLLTTLFLANAGNVEILRGPPRSVGEFSLRVIDADERLYAAAAAGADADARLLS